MDIWMTILSVVLFIVFLSVLIIVHELGHFTMCKVFKVYVFEYSIGMGPLIFKKKGKETQFSIRAIPFGGYVSMYDEEANLPEGVEGIDPARSMEATKKWKRALIMVAGVVMNLALSLVMYYIVNWIPRPIFYYNYIESNGTKIPAQSIRYDAKLLGSSAVILDEKALVTFTNGLQNNNVVAACSLTDFTFKNTSLDNYIDFYYPTEIETQDEEGNPVKTITISANDKIDISQVEYVEFTLNCEDVEATQKYLEEHPEVTNGIVLGNKQTIRLDVTHEDGKSYYSSTGLSFITDKDVAKGFGDSFKRTFEDFADGATTIIKSFGMLFTKEGISQAGGIVAIGFESSKILQNVGFSYYLRMWAMISVNLAIVNILPFPGLDGWHLVVLAVEGITKKKIPPKVKNIVSLVGIGILFVLMGALLFKDALKYVFGLGIRVL